MNQVDRRRIWIYLAFSFGISWLTALLVYLRGGLGSSRILIPGTPISEAFVLVAGLYMFAPAIANILTRLVTREGRADSWLRPNLRHGWPYWLAAWLGTFLLIVVGSVTFYLIFPQYFDRGLTQINDMLAAIEQQTGQPRPFSPEVFVLIQLIQALFLAPILNLLPTWGEEFGWRGYLLPKLTPGGERRAMLVSGLIWGIWHWPLIAMGYNYRLDYPGYPWLGFLAMTWFTLIAGTLLGWTALRGGSVWPAVIGHSVLNGIASGVALFTLGKPLLLLGPTVAGLAGGLGFSLFALWYYLFDKKARETRQYPPGSKPESITDNT